MIKIKGERRKKKGSREKGKTSHFQSPSGCSTLG
jgi:hypothetical protein